MRTGLETTQLGATGMEITRIGFGAWAIGGGGWEFGWGPQDDQQSLATIEHAIALGVNWIDTAAAYGFGRSEEVVGRALKGLPADSRPYVFTKCSLLEGPGRNGREQPHARLHPARGRGELEATPGRGDRPVPDSLPNPEPDIQEGWSALAELKEQGLVRHIGVSNFNVEQLQRIAQIAPVETLQPSYSLVARGVESEILPYAEREGMGVIVYSPMGSGLLSGGMTRERIANLPDDDWRRNDAKFSEPQLSKHLTLVERLRAVGEPHQTVPGAVAVAWTLANTAVSGAIVGFRRPDQVDAILTASDLHLSADEIAAIEGE